MNAATDTDKRLLMMSYEYPPLGGGGAKVVRGLADRLLEAGYTIDLVTMGFRRLPHIEKAGNLTIYRVPCIRLREDMCYAWEMLPYLLLAIPYTIWLLATRQYVATHCHFIFPDGLVRAISGIASKEPFVITAHGSDVPGYNPDRFHLLHRILLPVWRWVTNKADAIICPSRSISELIHRSNRNAQTVVIPNGIDLDRFDSNVPKKDTILVVTRMFERKGVQYLLEALRDMPNRYAVEIVGDGPYLDRLKSMAADWKLPVRFWGHLDNTGDELTDLYESSRIFVFTSEAENFPIVLLEAMVAGNAIITTSGTGCAEVVGDAALLVPPKDSHAIRAALETLMENPGKAEEMGRLARSRVSRHFGWPVVIEQTTATYAPKDI